MPRRFFPAPLVTLTIIALPFWSFAHSIILQTCQISLNLCFNPFCCHLIQSRQSSRIVIEGMLIPDKRALSQPWQPPIPAPSPSITHTFAPSTRNLFCTRINWSRFQMAKGNCNTCSLMDNGHLLAVRCLLLSPPRNDDDGLPGPRSQVRKYCYFWTLHHIK